MVTRAVPVPRSELAELVTIDRNSPIPLYFQVAQALQHAIEEGQPPPGSRLDSELQLADDLGLSRPTMRKAMEYLVDQGLLIRRRGIGTTVVQPKVRRPIQLSSLFDDLQTGGKRPSTSVLAFGVVPATPEVAQALNWPRRRSCTGSSGSDRRSSTHRPDDELPPDGPARPGPRGAYSGGARGRRALQAVPVRPTSTCTRPTKWWEPGRRRPAEAQLLDEPKGAALLTMQRIAYDDFGRAVEFGTHVYAASRYSLSLEPARQLTSRGRRRLRARGSRIGR